MENVERATVSGIKPHIPTLTPPASPGASLPSELKQVVLIGLSPSIAAHLMTPVRAVAPGAELQMMRPADLVTPAFPDGTLLIVQDRTPEADGLEIVRRLRGRNVAAPVILIVTGDDFQCPNDLDQLSDLDVIPLSEVSRFSLRRSLVLLSSRRDRQVLLEEVGGKLRAYERLLAARDEERQRVLDVATALERRLSATENTFQHTESDLAEKLARADAYAAELEQRLAELEAAGGKNGGDRSRAQAAEDARHRRQHALELAFLRDQRIQQDQELAELRKTCEEQKRELLRLEAQRVQVGDMATRLQASERVRTSQTQVILVYQRRIQEIEQNLATIAALLQAEDADPDSLLEELAARLAQVESMRSEQQSTIDQLSRSLAEQQIDNALDERPSRTDVVVRVDEAVRRSDRLGTPLNCLMIGIDDAMGLRSEVGSISYDFMQVQIAQRLQLTLRSGDVVMRYGDGEFVLITDAKTVVNARSHAERLIREVCNAPLELGERRRKIGISIAVLAYDQALGSAHELLRRAKGTLLEAQARGDRQILVGTAGTVPPPDSEAITQRVPAS